MTMGYFQHRLRPFFLLIFLHFWLSWCPRNNNIYKATLSEEHISTTLVTLTWSKCHSPPRREYFILGWLWFYLKERGARSPWAGMQMPHSSDRPPPPGIAVTEQKWKWVPGVPDHIRSGTHLKLSLNMHFFSLPQLVASLYACFCFSVVNVIRYICWALWFLRYVHFVLIAWMLPPQFLFSRL